MPFLFWLPVILLGGMAMLVSDGAQASRLGIEMLSDGGPESNHE